MSTCFPTKVKAFNYLICVKTWLFESRKEFSRDAVIYFTSEQEGEHVNYDVMILFAAGQPDVEGK